MIPAGLDADARDAYEAVMECDGYEVHRDDWPVFERLVVAGLITLGPQRGPDRNWRRAEPVVQE